MKINLITVLVFFTFVASSAHGCTTPDDSKKTGGPQEFINSPKSTPSTGNTTASNSPESKKLIPLHHENGECHSKKFTYCDYAGGAYYLINERGEIDSHSSSAAMCVFCKKYQGMLHLSHQTQ